MKEKPPAFQWYPKQFLGDDDVLGMDWDARGMHVWLLNLAWQQDPRGTVPNDDALLRRWFSLPSGKKNDATWRRVKPQIMCAWVVLDGRLGNLGLMASAAKQQMYSDSRKQSADARWMRKPCESIEEEEALVFDVASREAEQIYELYPRKVSKPAAVKAILKAIDREGKKLGGKAEAVAYLKVQATKYGKAPPTVAKIKNGELQYIPHPATWFNREQYNDEQDWIQQHGPTGTGKSTATKQDGIRARNAAAERELAATLGFTHPDAELLPAGDVDRGAGDVARTVINMPLRRGGGSD